MEDKITRYLTAAACVMMGIAVGIVACYGLLLTRVIPASAGPAVVQEEETDEIAAGQRKYAELMGIIDQCYIGDDPDMTAVNDAMAAAVVAGIGDRWSYYISAEDYQSYQNNLQNSYVGVGITISAYYNEESEFIGYEVTEVSQGGPAEAAGVLAGDILIRADGTDLSGISLQETKNIVQGEEGTTVRLAFLRDDNIIEYDVERRAFNVIPAEGRMLDHGVGYIRIDNFDSGCADAVIALVEQLQGEGATSLLFDVRNNPGGMKIELTALLDYLLPEGVIFHTVDFTGSEELVESDASCVELPMAVLVNADSYSAAEYFACALQEYGVGTVVGEKTFGKGYYQTGIMLSDGSCVNLSVGKYYTPQGKSLIDLGVTPDVELSLDTELAALLAKHQLEPENDPQLQAAMDCLLK